MSFNQKIFSLERLTIDKLIAKETNQPFISKQYEILDWDENDIFQKNDKVIKVQDIDGCKHELKAPYGMHIICKKVDKNRKNIGVRETIAFFAYTPSHKAALFLEKLKIKNDVTLNRLVEEVFEEVDNLYCPAYRQRLLINGHFNISFYISEDEYDDFFKRYNQILNEYLEYDKTLPELSSLIIRCYLSATLLQCETRYIKMHQNCRSVFQIWNPEHYFGQKVNSISIANSFLSILKYLITFSVVLVTYNVEWLRPISFLFLGFILINVMENKPGSKSRKIDNYGAYLDNQVSNLKEEIGSDKFSLSDLKQKLINLESKNIVYVNTKIHLLIDQLI